MVRGLPGLTGAGGEAFPAIITKAQFGRVGKTDRLLRLSIGHETGKGACDTPKLNARRFEEMIIEKVRSSILTDASITKLVKAVDEEMYGIASKQRKRLETIDDELEDVKRRLAAIWNAIDISDASDRIKEQRGRSGGRHDSPSAGRTWTT